MLRYLPIRGQPVLIVRNRRTDLHRPADDILPQALAQLSVEALIRDGIVIDPPSNPIGVLAWRAGAFVTIRKLDGQLRGCIGTIEGEYPNVAREIVKNAISAATRDPRFPPVSISELPGLIYSVDVLSIPEAVRGPEDLDPTVYGVIVETLDGSRRGLLLPGIAGLDSAPEQWLAVHSKAGINVGTPVRAERFSVTRYGKD